MVNICKSMSWGFFRGTFAQSHLKQWISLTSLERGFLSVLTRNVISIFYECNFFHNCCFMFGLLLAGKRSILISQLGIETLQSYFLPFELEREIIALSKLGSGNQAEKGVTLPFLKGSLC